MCERHPTEVREDSLAHTTPQLHQVTSPTSEPSKNPSKSVDPIYSPLPEQRPPLSARRRRLQRRVPCSYCELVGRCTWSPPYPRPCHDTAQYPRRQKINKLYTQHTECRTPPEAPIATAAAAPGCIPSRRARLQPDCTEVHPNRLRRLLVRSSLNLLVSLLYYPLSPSPPSTTPIKGTYIYHPSDSQDGEPTTPPRKNILCLHAHQTETELTTLPLIIAVTQTVCAAMTYPN